MLGLPDLRGVLLVRDTLDSDAGFLLLQLLKLALQPSPEGWSVVLLASRHAAAHYTQTLRKAGVGLPALAEQGRVAVVDVLQRLAQQPAGTGQEGRLLDLRELLDATRAAAAALDASRPLCLLADDLSVLRCVAAGQEAWPAFLNSCCSLGHGLQRRYCFVGLAHADVEEDGPWVARLAARASVVVDVEPLGGGVSREVAGRVVVTRRDAAAGDGPPDGFGGDAASSPVLGQKLSYYGIQGAGTVHYLGEGAAKHFKL